MAVTLVFFLAGLATDKAGCCISIDYSFHESVHGVELFFHPPETIRIKGDCFSGSKTGKAVFMVPGRGAGAEVMLETGLSFARSGYEVLIFSPYRGCDSAGEEDERRLIKVRQAVSILSERYRTEEILLMGHSDGAELLVKLAALPETARNPYGAIAVIGAAVSPVRAGAISKTVLVGRYDEIVSKKEFQAPGMRVFQSPLSNHFTELMDPFIKNELIGSGINIPDILFFLLRAIKCLIFLLLPRFSLYFVSNFSGAITADGRILSAVRLIHLTGFFLILLLMSSEKFLWKVAGTVLNPSVLAFFILLAILLLTAELRGCVRPEKKGTFTTLNFTFTVSVAILLSTINLIVAAGIEYGIDYEYLVLFILVQSINSFSALIDWLSRIILADEPVLAIGPVAINPPGLSIVVAELAVPGVLNFLRVYLHRNHISRTRSFFSCDRKKLIVFFCLLMLAASLWIWRVVQGLDMLALLEIQTRIFFKLLFLPLLFLGGIFWKLRKGRT